MYILLREYTLSHFTSCNKFKNSNVGGQQETIHHHDTMGGNPGERVMELLERYPEVLPGEFISEDVVNILWVIPTMGTKPGERMMGQLERRPEELEGDFKSQDVTNTLWSFTTMGSCSILSHHDKESFEEKETLIRESTTVVIMFVYYESIKRD